MSVRVTTPAPGAVPPAALDAAATALRLGTTDETAVGEIIGQVTDLAERLAKLRFLWFRTYEAVLEGDGDDRLYLLAGRPLATVTEVKQGVDGDPLLEGSEAADYDVWNDDGFLYREDCWPAGEAPVLLCVVSLTESQRSSANRPRGYRTCHQPIMADPPTVGRHEL